VAVGTALRRRLRAAVPPALGASGRALPALGVASVRATGAHRATSPVDTTLSPAEVAPSPAPGGSRAPRAQAAAAVAGSPAGATAASSTPGYPVPTSTACLLASTSPGARSFRAATRRTGPRRRRAPSGDVVHAPGAGVHPR